MFKKSLLFSSLLFLSTHHFPKDRTSHKALPQHKMGHVWDSGEKDAQVYKFIKEKYPKSVTSYSIRDVERLKSIISHENFNHRR